MYNSRTCAVKQQSSSFCTSVVLKRVAKIHDSLSALKSVQDSQIQLTLVRACLSLPKISFALCTCAPHLMLPTLEAFDEGMREALSDIVGAPVSEWSWQKASLPCSMGGLGLRRASLHAPAAYTSSLHQCLRLMSGILGHSPLHQHSLSICLPFLHLLADPSGRLFRALMSLSISGHFQSQPTLHPMMLWWIWHLTHALRL